jgi:hypothetical protein
MVGREKLLMKLMNRALFYCSAVKWISYVVIVEQDIGIWRQQNLKASTLDVVVVEHLYCLQ